MIIKTFELQKLNNLKKKSFLFYGENEGLKNEVITKYFQVNFVIFHPYFIICFL